MSLLLQTTTYMSLNPEERQVFLLPRPAQPHDVHVTELKRATLVPITPFISYEIPPASNICSNNLVQQIRDPSLPKAKFGPTATRFILPSTRST
jgi:hypothetical protein